MRNILPTLMTSLLVLQLLAACASPPKRELSRTIPEYVALPNGHDPLDPKRAAPMFKGFEGGLFAGKERALGRRLQVLELSGGGQKGAFGAGVLVGWSESGKRPKFDIVTGVSVGGLLATFAFLGEAEDDRAVEAIFTGITKDDIYREGGFLRVLTGGNSLMDSEPLAQLIAKYITEETLERVAAEAAKGRVLAIATLNLDYQQTWVWNLTSIAAQGGPKALETYRNVLRAGASPPIAFPAVEIEGFLFADGGTQDRLLAAGLAGRGTAKDAHVRSTPGDIHIIFNDRMYTEPAAIRASLKGIVTGALDAIMKGNMESNLLRAFAMSRIHGYNFHLAIIPKGVDVRHDDLAFDPTDMRAMFEAGRKFGRDPGAWLHVPPTGQVFAPWMIKVLDGLEPEEPAR